MADVSSGGGSLEKSRVMVNEKALEMVGTLAKQLGQVATEQSRAIEAIAADLNALSLVLEGKILCPDCGMPNEATAGNCVYCENDNKRGVED